MRLWKSSRIQPSALSAAEGAVEGERPPDGRTVRRSDSLTVTCHPDRSDAKHHEAERTVQIGPSTPAWRRQACGRDDKGCARAGEVAVVCGAAIAAAWAVRCYAQAVWWATPAILLAAGIVPFLARRQSPPAILRVETLGHDMRTAACTSLAILPLLYWAIWLIDRAGVSLPWSSARPLNYPAWVLYQFLYVAVAEEVFFRGYVLANIFSLFARRRGLFKQVPPLRPGDARPAVGMTVGQSDRRTVGQSSTEAVGRLDSETVRRSDGPTVGGKAATAGRWDRRTGACHPDRSDAPHHEAEGSFQTDAVPSNAEGFLHFGPPSGSPSVAMSIQHWAAIAASSACFAAAHAVIQGQASGLLTFLPGLVLGWLFVRTGTLLSPVLFHGLANVVWQLAVSG